MGDEEIIRASLGLMPLAALPCIPTRACLLLFDFQTTSSLILALLPHGTLSHVPAPASSQSFSLLPFASEIGQRDGREKGRRDGRGGREIRS